MIFFLLNFGPVPDGQTDRQTDRKRLLRAHRALAQVGSKIAVLQRVFKNALETTFQNMKYNEFWTGDFLSDGFLFSLNFGSVTDSKRCICETYKRESCHRFMKFARHVGQVWQNIKYIWSSVPGKFN